MHIIIPDDYQDAVRHLDSFRKVAGHAGDGRLLTNWTFVDR